MTNAERELKYKEGLKGTIFQFNTVAYEETGRQHVVAILETQRSNEFRAYFRVLLYGLSRASGNNVDIVMQIMYKEVKTGSTDEKEVCRRVVILPDVSRVDISTLCKAAKIVDMQMIGYAIQKSSLEYYNIFKQRYKLYCPESDNVKRDERVHKFIRYFLADDFVERHVYNQTWVSGSSTNVFPITYDKHKVIVQWRGNRPCNKFIIDTVSQNADLFEFGEYKKSDGSCPNTLLFWFKSTYKEN